MNRKPHARLKALRNLLELTQGQLAKRIGVSQSYILALEIGQRQMSERLAQLVARATFVSDYWLLGRCGSDDAPLSMFLQPLTKKLSDHYTRRGAMLNKPIEALSDESFAIDDLCYLVACVMRAAYRKGVGGVAHLRFRQAITDVTKTLRIEQLAKEEVANLDPIRQLPDGYFEAWRMVSPSAKFSWSDAAKNGEQEQQEFVNDIKLLLETVEESFRRLKKQRSSRPRRKA